MDRISFGFPSPNVAGSIIAACISLVAYSIEKHRQKANLDFYSIISYVFLFCLCVLLALTLSRAGVLALFVCALGLLFVLKRLPIALLIGMTVPITGLFFHGRTSGLATDASILTRWDVWKGGIRIAMDNSQGVSPEVAQAILLPWHLPVGSAPNLLGFLSDPITSFVYHGYAGLAGSLFGVAIVLIGWISARGTTVNYYGFVPALLLSTTLIITSLFQYHSYYLAFFIAKWSVIAIVGWYTYFAVRREAILRYFLCIVAFLIISTLSILIVAGYNKTFLARFDKESNGIVVMPLAKSPSTDLNFISDYFTDQISYGQKYGRQLIAAGYTLHVNPMKINDRFPAVIIQPTCIKFIPRAPTLLLDPISTPDFYSSLFFVVNTKTSILGNRLWGKSYARFPLPTVCSLESDSDFLLVVKDCLARPR